MVPAHVKQHETSAVVIGASAGGIDALTRILPGLSADARLPFIVVVHLPPTKPSLLVDVFAPRCRLPVREPFDKQPIEPGIWVAPPDYHILVEAGAKGHTFAMSVDEPVNFSRPSIDVLFESAAETYGARLTAVVLTGASRDGADGARRVREMGGTVYVQDPRGAEVEIMPRAAIAASSPQLIAPLESLAKTLHDISRGTP